MKKERIIYLTVITVLLALLIGCVAVGADFVGGFSRLDLNEDGTVDISDVTYLLNYLSRGCEHEHVVTEPGYPAACREVGFTDGRWCKDCGKILLVREEIPALGHDFVDGFCSRCGRPQDTVGLVFELDGDSYVVTGYNGSDTEVIIPNLYNGLPVTAIGEEAFDENDRITYVEIPEGVTEIGEYAFYYCENLREAVLPSTLTTIGKGAFYCCYSLQTVDLPAGLTFLDASAFYSCESITSVVIPEGITTIPRTAFEYCFALTDVILPESLETIEDYAFYCCTSLCSIRLPSNVRTINQEAFGDCYALVEVLNDSGLTLVCGSEDNGCVACYAKEIHTGQSRVFKIGDFSFYTADGVSYLVGFDRTDADLVLPADCNGEPYELLPRFFYHVDALRSLTVPEGITAIPEDLCIYCDYLQSVTLPSTLTSIGDYAFFSCDRLMSVNIPENVASIGESAFEYCYKLYEVVNNSSLPIVCGSEDYGCVAYFAVSVHSGASRIANVEDFLFLTAYGVNYLLGYDGDDARMLTLPTRYQGENYEIAPYAFDERYDLGMVFIPSGVTAIGDYAFEYCDGLEYVEMADSVVRIGESAFEDCEALTTLKLGNGVRSIGEAAFRNCYKLTEVTIPNGVETIPEEAFIWCESLKTVTIPASVTEIGEDAFCGCDDLTAVYFGGSEEQWRAITIGDYNDKLTGATMVFAIG